MDDVISVKVRSFCDGHRLRRAIASCASGPLSVARLQWIKQVSVTVNSKMAGVQAVFESFRLECCTASRFLNSPGRLVTAPSSGKPWQKSLS